MSKTMKLPVQILRGAVPSLIVSAGLNFVCYYFVVSAGLTFVCYHFVVVSAGLSFFVIILSLFLQV